MKVLVLGDGLLGNEVCKQTGWNYISRKKDGIDFTNIESYVNFLSGYDCVFNCVGHTDTYGLERDIHWRVNYLGVIDLVGACNELNLKLIHVSTDFLYTNSIEYASENDVPVHCRNWYGYTKLLSDGYVQAKSNDYLMFRASYKDYPFPYSRGWLTKGNFDYVNRIASLMIDLINNQCFGLYNIGTKTKTLYELGKETKQF